MLKGVESLAFDCKVATLTMKAGATLAESEVIGALKKAGFEPIDFAARGVPTASVVVAQLAAKTGALDDVKAQQAAARLVKALPAASEWLVAADGRVVVRLPERAELDVAAATEAARRELAGLEVELRSFAEEQWPTTAARATVVVRRAAANGASDSLADQRAAIVAAIGSLPHALAVLPLADARRFVVFTREPCANLAERAREKLVPLALEVEAVELPPAEQAPAGPRG